MRRSRHLSQSAGYNHVHKSELTAHLYKKKAHRARFTSINVCHLLFTSSSITIITLRASGGFGR